MAFYLLDKWREYKSDLTVEFYSHISGLLENDMVVKLDNYTQHYCYTRLKHSLDVAYYSFMIGRFLRWDSKSIARGGLLHDLFLYDWRDEDYVCEGRNHAVEHPKIALRNAREICEDLNEVEADIILKHMWLVTLKPPRYKEGFIVTFVDKYCASKELLMSLFTRSDLRTVFVNNA